MPEIVLFHTIPGSGTRLVRALLESHSQIRYIRLNTSASLSPLVTLLGTGRIDETRFDQLIAYAACVQKDDGDPIRNEIAQAHIDEFFGWNGIAEVIEAHPCKVVTLYTHMLLRRPHTYHKDVKQYWIPDLYHLGYHRKTVTPLRDPALILCTAIIRGQGVAAKRPAFAFLNEYPDEVETFFLPIEVYAKMTSDERVEQGGKLFEDFLGLPLEAETEALMRQWPVVNPVDSFLLEQPAQNLCFDETAKRDLARRMRARLLRREPALGLVPELDMELSYCSEMEGLKSLYRKHGYQDLCWF